MKNSRSTADRIRPILQAMERSIESARRRRLNELGAPPVSGSVEPEEPAAPDTGEVPRRKARPKRSPMTSRFDPSGFQAKRV